MTRTHSNEEMIAIMARHDAFEAAGDVEGTMSTVSANPRWELYPLGYVIEGRAALTEFYRRVLPSVRHVVPALKKKNFWFEDNGYAVEFELDMVDEAGQPFVSRIITAFRFEDGLVQAERGFMSEKHAQGMADLLGSDFVDLPGVTVVP